MYPFPRTHSSFNDSTFQLYYNSHIFKLLLSELTNININCPHLSVLLSSSTRKLLLKLENLREKKKSNPGLNSLSETHDNILFRLNEPPPRAVRRLRLLLLRSGRRLNLKTFNLSSHHRVFFFCFFYNNPVHPHIRLFESTTHKSGHFLLLFLSLFYSLYFQFCLMQLLPVHSGAFKSQTPGGKVRPETQRQVLLRTFTQVHVAF